MGAKDHSAPALVFCRSLGKSRPQFKEMWHSPAQYASPLAQRQSSLSLRRPWWLQPTLYTAALLAGGLAITYLTSTDGPPSVAIHWERLDGPEARGTVTNIGRSALPALALRITRGAGLSAVRDAARFSDAGHYTERLADLQPGETCTFAVELSRLGPLSFPPAVAATTNGESSGLHYRYRQTWNGHSAEGDADL